MLAMPRVMLRNSSNFSLGIESARPLMLCSSVGVLRVGVLRRRRGDSWELEREGVVVGRPMCRAWAQLRGK